MVDETWVQVMVMMRLQKSSMKALRKCKVMIHRRIVIMTLLRMVMVTLQRFMMMHNGDDNIFGKVENKNTYRL